MKKNKLNHSIYTTLALIILLLGILVISLMLDTKIYALTFADNIKIDSKKTPNSKGLGYSKYLDESERKQQEIVNNIYNGLEKNISKNVQESIYQNRKFYLLF